MRTMTMPIRTLLLIAAGLGAAACAGGRADEIPMDQRSETPTPVSVLQLEPTGFTERLELSGTLEPWLEVEVTSELGGRVESVGFEDGQHVAAGRVLARVGTDLLEAARAEAEAVLLGAEADYERAQKLFDREAIPRQQLLTATSRYEAARAQVEQARIRVGRSIVQAPVAGVALRREVETGEVLAPGARITTLHQVGRLKAAGGIPESDVAAFETGDEAEVEVDAYPGEIFAGRIHFIGAAAVGPSRTFPVEVAVDNADRRLRPGMIARLSLVKAQLEGVVVVDQDVLQERDEGRAAVVVEGESARIRPVTLGATEGNRVVILSGLSPGDTLVVSGQRGLTDGQRVEIVERAQAPAEESAE
jgi:membrane fusion protein (multidrug efflux system)